MNGGAWLPLLASLVALWFALVLARQFAAKRKGYQFWWALSMLSYALASFGEYYALAFGWNVPMYKCYYLNAVALVAIMAVGEVYILVQKRRLIGHVYAWLTVIGVLWFSLLLFQVQPDLTVLAQHDAAIGGDALAKNSVIRTVFPPFLSGIGGILLIVGPLFSWWKSRFRGNLFIAGGALILSAAGRLAALGHPGLLPLAELLGIVVIFYGVALQGNRVRRQIPGTIAEENSPKG